MPASKTSRWLNALLNGKGLKIMKRKKQHKEDKVAETEKMENEFYETPTSHVDPGFSRQTRVVSNPNSPNGCQGAEEVTVEHLSKAQKLKKKRHEIEAWHQHCKVKSDRSLPTLAEELQKDPEDVKSTRRIFNRTKSDPLLGLESTSLEETDDTSLLTSRSTMEQLEREKEEVMNMLSQLERTKAELRQWMQDFNASRSAERVPVNLGHIDVAQLYYERRLKEAEMETNVLRLERSDSSRRIADLEAKNRFYESQLQRSESLGNLQHATKNAAAYDVTGSNTEQDTMRVKKASTPGNTYAYVYGNGEWKIVQQKVTSMKEPKGARVEQKEGSHHSAPESSMKLPSKANATTTTPTITEEQVHSLFSLWNQALATGDPRLVAARYSSEAVLLPTVSDTPRTDFESIKDYFVGFLSKKPQGTILESHIRIGEGWCKDSGIYEFTMGTTGGKVKARYTFIYTFEDNQWKIAHHHSSVMPEGVDIATPITKEEVQGLFHLRNDALLTGDSSLVAKRYAKDGVLLPTVSDKPRDDFHSIKNYFDEFLMKKPRGEILESYVSVGTNWCQDAGIYEFTLAATGDKVKARYSFIYKYEDGEWKISHHHSSVMPEGVPPPAEKQVKGRGLLLTKVLPTRLDKAYEIEAVVEA